MKLFTVGPVENEKYILEYEQNMIKNSVVFFLFA